MGKINKFGEIVNYIFSASRFGKIRLLLKEQLMGFHPNAVLGQISTQQSSFNVKEDVWVYRDTRKIDKGFFDRSSVASIEDELGNDGFVHTEHEYLVFNVPNACSYTNAVTHRSVFLNSGKLIPELSSKRLNANPPAGRRLKIDRIVPGVTVNLYGTIASAEGNYFHWFIDALSRLFLIERFYSLDDINYVLVPSLKYDFQWDSLAAFGFDRSQVIELQPLECLRFESLLASSSPRGKSSSICPGWAIDRYRENLLNAAKGTKSVTGKKVYVSRRDAPRRMFLNEEAVSKFFESRGFDVVELTLLNLHQKIAVFRDAEIIVSATGAGLTNALFCSNNVKVVELVDENFVYLLYASMVAYVGGQHHAHFFSSDSALSKVNAIMAQSSLDIDELEKTLEKNKL